MEKNASQPVPPVMSAKNLNLNSVYSLIIVAIILLTAAISSGAVYFWHRQKYNLLLNQSSQMVFETMEESRRLIQEREEAINEIDPVIFQVNELANTKQFIDPYYGISFNFPAGWSHEIGGVWRDEDRLTYNLWLCAPPEVNCDQHHSLIFAVSPTDVLPVDAYLKEKKEEITNASGQWRVSHWRGGGRMGFEDPNSESVGQRGITAGFLPNENKIKYVYFSFNAFYPEEQRSEFESAAQDILDSFSYVPPANASLNSWQIFKNDEYNYQVKYPPGAVVSDAYQTHPNNCIGITLGESFVNFGGRDTGDEFLPCSPTGVGAYAKKASETVTISGKNYQANGFTYEDEFGHDGWYSFTTDTGIQITYGAKSCETKEPACLNQSLEEKISPVRKIAESFKSLETLSN